MLGVPLLRQRSSIFPVARGNSISLACSSSAAPALAAHPLAAPVAPGPTPPRPPLRYGALLHRSVACAIRSSPSSPTFCFHPSPALPIIGSQNLLKPTLCLSKYLSFNHLRITRIYLMFVSLSPVALLRSVAF